MKLSREQVAQVAALARLDLDDAELDALTGQMGSILAYVETLNELDTDGIVPTAHAVPMENAFRADEERPSLDRELVMERAPASDQGCFRVPKVIE